MTKKDIQHLKDIAGNLPKTRQDANVKSIVTGAELIEKGITKLNSGEVVLPEKKYLRKLSDSMPVNHFRRLKSVYKSAGVKGVKSYCNQVLELHKNASNATI